MIREQVVITPVNITKAGQVKHFQVKLPKNAKRIIGIELGGRILTHGEVAIIRDTPFFSPVAGGVEGSSGSAGGAASGSGSSGSSGEIRLSGLFKRNKLIGEVKLQSCEEANIFYAGHLQTDENIAMGDFSQSRTWVPSAFTHQAQSFEERVIVDGESTMIQGMYRDRLGEQTKVNYNYIVNVYVWIEIEEPIIKQ
jgi:hypothetical protein